MARVNLTEMVGAISPHAAKPSGTGLLSALAEPRAGDASPAMVPIGDVDPHPGNVRTELGDLTELAASIKAVGIIQPLVVVAAALWNRANPNADASAGRFVVIAGHRRLAAAELAGLTDVPIVVRDELADPQAATTAMLIENIHRQNLAPLDEAAAMAALSKAGLGQREIASRTGISQATVSKRIALLKLTAAGQQAIRDAHLSPDVALELLKLPRDRQDPVLTAGIQAGDVRGAISREQESLAQETRRQQIIDELTAAGATVVDDAEARIGEHDGSIYARYLLSGADDIAEARSAGLAFATVEPYGFVTWWCTVPTPWPWQETAADDSDRITPQGSPPRQVARANRTRAIAEYLASPTQPAELLADLVLISRSRYDDDQVAAYLGFRDAGRLDDALEPADSAERLRAAIAVAAAGIERAVTRDGREESTTPAGRDYLALLEQRTGYRRPEPDAAPATTIEEGPQQ